MSAPVASGGFLFRLFLFTLAYHMKPRSNVEHVFDPRYLVQPKNGTKYKGHIQYLINGVRFDSRYVLYLFIHVFADLHAPATRISL